MRSMRWPSLRGRHRDAPGPNAELDAELERVAERIVAAADEAPPPRRVSEVRLTVLSALDDAHAGRAPGLELAAVAMVALTVALLVGVGGAVVGSWLVDEPGSAEPTVPAELSDGPESTQLADPTPPQRPGTDATATDAATGDPSLSVEPEPSTAAGGGEAPNATASPDPATPGGSQPPATLPPQASASPGGPPSPIPTPPDRGPP